MNIIMLMVIRLFAQILPPPTSPFTFTSPLLPYQHRKTPLFHLTLAQLNSSYLLCILTYLPQLPTYQS